MLKHLTPFYMSLTKFHSNRFGGNVCPISNVSIIYIYIYIYMVFGYVDLRMNKFFFQTNINKISSNSFKILSSVSKHLKH
jgi:hypothetical protein